MKIPRSDQTIHSHERVAIRDGHAVPVRGRNLEDIHFLWAGDSPLPGAARERLLEASTRCIARDGIDGLSMAAVATDAGVSRPTVYRYFADRRALLEATLFYAGRSLADSLSERLRGHASPAEKAIEAMLFVHGEIPRDPVLGALWSATRLAR